MFKAINNDVDVDTYINISTICHESLFIYHLPNVDVASSPLPCSVDIVHGCTGPDKVVSGKHFSTNENSS